LGFGIGLGRNLGFSFRLGRSRGVGLCSVAVRSDGALEFADGVAGEEIDLGYVFGLELLDEPVVRDSLRPVGRDVEIAGDDGQNQERDNEAGTGKSARRLPLFVREIVLVVLRHGLNGESVVVLHFIQAEARG
jgi:hypothetical protein